MSEKVIKVIIADDHALMREGLVKILSLESNITVVGEAVDGNHAVELSRSTDVDIILMDINMPNLNGIEATKTIRKENPEIGVIALTIHDQEDYLFEMIRCGVSGYVLKDVSPDELINTIRGVAAGQSFIPPALMTKVFQEFNRMAEQKDQPYKQYGLTSRELEVLAEIARGLSNKDIAKKLYISEKTVKNHLTNIFQKLDVHDRTQAALFAIKHNIVDI
ncbi:MAG: response regulator transcription factor [Firmicutes bacterium]|nr:response regulator transcription factor [Bacillota bacterium]